ncbi:hypothetical protein EV426DRAFT_706858 [Tirmania nivea]|nr:hypothetical protein EV426DRAFT_706858 [Tirmania nivea]
MSPPRQVQGPRYYPFEGQPYQSHHHGFGTVAGPGSDNTLYQYGYLPMNAMLQPHYPNQYYQNMSTLAYPLQMPPHCAPSYGNLAASQDPSVVCYSCASHPPNGAPMMYYPPHFMGVPDYYAMYTASGIPSPVQHFSPQAPPPATTIPPPLEYRRGSCSTAESNTAPQTPALSSTYVESTPSIAGESSQGMPQSPASDRCAASRAKFTIQPRFRASEMPPSGVARNSLYNPSKTTNVYIRGLAPDTDDEKLLRLVEKYGHVESHKAIIDKVGFCKGYGFALFKNMEDAKACILGVANANLDAGFARESFNSRLKALGDPTSTNLYVSNLPTSVDETKMSEIFKDYQTMSVRILRDAQGISRGVGFVRFANHEICDEVIERFNDKVVIEGCAEIQVRYADTYAQKTLKEATTRIREFYCNEQKRTMGVGDQGVNIPTGPRFGWGGRKWNSGARMGNGPRLRTFL